MMENSQKINLINYSGKLPQKAHRFSHNAMATVFEIIIIHEDARYVEQSAYQAFCELDRLEQELSKFIENSDISRINSSGVNQPVRVGLETFECLELCACLSMNTNNAFDVTVGPLLKCWSNGDKTFRIPTKQDLIRARESTGMHLVHLDKNQFTVTLRSDRMCIDLGGFGKGYAVDRMAKVLDNWDINSALIHGGTSSVLALGAPTGERGWHVTIRNPKDYNQIISYLYLRNRAISGSGIRKGQHIIDPQTAYPVNGKYAAWAISTSAAASDALSTAFMIMSPEEIKDYCLNNDDIQAIIIMKETENKEKILRFGEFKHLE